MTQPEMETTVKEKSLVQKQLDALIEPIRFKLFTTLQKPRTITEVADVLGVDRKSLYYHLQILLEKDLVEELESHKVRGCVETTYKNRDILFEREEIQEKDREKLQSINYNCMQAMYESWRRSMEGDFPERFIISHTALNIKSENRQLVYRSIAKIMLDAMNKIMELQDDEGDLEYEAAFTSFQSSPRKNNTSE